MKKFTLVLLLLPLVCHAYEDHRGRNLDSLARSISRWTPPALAKASKEEKIAYCMTCRELMWGYLQLDGNRCIYYAKEAMAIGQEFGGYNTVIDVSILIGQCFWASSQYDSAAVYYAKAEEAVRLQELVSEDQVEVDGNKARLWGTLGNFWQAQDSIGLMLHYYALADPIFQKYEWWEDCSTLHRNLGEMYIEKGQLKEAKPELDEAIQYARQSGDSLLIVGALYSLGHWYQEKGKTKKALEYVTQAYQYFGDHPVEEAVGRADTLAVMNAAHEELYRNARMLAIGAFLVLLLTIGGTLLVRRLRLTRQELSETSAVLDETIEELRPAGDVPMGKVHLTKREKDVAKLLMDGQPTKQIAHSLGISDETVLWYRKRLFAKLNVHSAAAFATEVMKRGLLE